MQQLTLEMPLYVQVLIGVLTLAWIYVMLPERFKPRRRNAAPRYLQIERDAAPAVPVPAARTPKVTLEQLATTDSRQLQALVRAFWQARACAVETIGSDLLIRRPSTGRLFAVARCNAAASAHVGVAEIEALWALVQRHSAPLGLYYGLGGFAPEASAFVKDKHLKLVAGGTLVAEIDSLKPEQQRELHARLAPEMRAAA